MKGGQMFNRVLLAMDQFEAGRAALQFTRDLASPARTNVRVFHVVEFAGRGRGAPLETPDEASRLVEEAVFHLRMGGVGAEGGFHSAMAHRVGHRLVAEAERWGADSIVLGSRRRHGAGRLLSQGVREQVVRCTDLPVLTAPRSGAPGLGLPRQGRSTTPR